MDQIKGVTETKPLTMSHIWNCRRCSAGGGRADLEGVGLSDVALAVIEEEAADHVRQTGHMVEVGNMSFRLLATDRPPALKPEEAAVKLAFEKWIERSEENVLQPRPCSFCGVSVGYILIEGNAFFLSGCACSTIASPPEFRSWASMAEAFEEERLEELRPYYLTLEQIVEHEAADEPDSGEVEECAECSVGLPDGGFHCDECAAPLCADHLVGVHDTNGKHAEMCPGCAADV